MKSVTLIIPCPDLDCSIILLEQIMPGILHKIYENNDKYLTSLIEGCAIYEDNGWFVGDLSDKGEMHLKRDSFYENIYQACLEEFKEFNIDRLINGFIKTHFIREVTIKHDDKCILMMTPKYYFNWGENY